MKKAVRGSFQKKKVDCRHIHCPSFRNISEWRFMGEGSEMFLSSFRLWLLCKMELIEPRLLGLGCWDCSEGWRETVQGMKWQNRGNGFTVLEDGVGWDFGKKFLIST